MFAATTPIPWKAEAQDWADAKATRQPRPLGLHIGACGACVCSDTHSCHHPLGPASDGICFLLFIFSLGSHLLVFIFHLWMGKIFLHVSAFWNRFLIIYFQLFNVNIWAATKSADKCIMFPIICHNICFFLCVKHSGDVVSPTSTLWGLFWNFCQPHGQCLESWERGSGACVVTGCEDGFRSMLRYPWTSCVDGRNEGGVGRNEGGGLQ